MKKKDLFYYRTKYAFLSLLHTHMYMYMIFVDPFQVLPVWSSLSAEQFHQIAQYATTWIKKFATKVARQSGLRRGDLRPLLNKLEISYQEAYASLQSRFNNRYHICLYICMYAYITHTFSYACHAC